MNRYIAAAEAAERPFPHVRGDEPVGEITWKSIRRISPRAWG